MGVLWFVVYYCDFFCVVRRLDYWLIVGCCMYCVVVVGLFCYYVGRWLFIGGGVVVRVLVYYYVGVYCCE